jgi:plastocyanin
MSILMSILTCSLITRLRAPMTLVLHPRISDRVSPTAQRRQPRRNAFRMLLVTGLLLSGAACGSDGSGSSLTDPDHLFWRVALNHRAVTLSVAPPSNTLQLAATPVNSQGESLESDTVIFTTTTSAVSVSPTGLLTALSARSGGLIRIAITAGGVTLKDSVFVNVVNVTPIPTFETITIQTPLGTTGDCFPLGISMIGAQLLGQGSAPITGAAVAYTSSNPTAAKIAANTGLITPACVTEPTPVTLYATATVYGVAKTDSITYTVLPTHFMQVDVVPLATTGSTVVRSAFNPGTIYISAGGTVAWRNASKQPVDIVFDDPSAAKPSPVSVFPGLIPTSTDSGNVAATEPDTANAYATKNWSVRTFPIPGTYHYQSTMYGTTGTIVVRAIDD